MCSKNAVGTFLSGETHLDEASRESPFVLESESPTKSGNDSEDEDANRSSQIAKTSDSKKFMQSKNNRRQLKNMHFAKY